MNRPIKFNAYIPDLNIILENVAVYGNGTIGISADYFGKAIKDKFVVDDEGRVLVLDYFEKEEFESIMTLLTGDDWYWIEEQHYELMQNTGIKSKEYQKPDGAEIYEGHIVRSEGSRLIGAKNYVVEFKDGCFVATGYNGGVQISPLLNHTSYNIVGNKFQNPELLPNGKTWREK